MSIHLLAFVFTAVTVVAVLAVLYRFRRLPVVALIAAREREVAGLHQAVTAIEASIAAERADGRLAQLGTLTAELDRRRRALAISRATADFPKTKIR